MTERSKTERVLEAPGSRFRQLMDDAPVSITLFDAECKKFLDANQATVKLLGFDSKEAFVAAQVDQDPVENPFVSTILEQLKSGPINNFEVTVKRKDGRRLWLTMNVFPITNDQGEVNYLAAAFDITEHKKREERLRDVTHELDSFSYSVSHDLRAPLRLISGYSSMLEEDYMDKLDAEGRKMISTIQKGVDKMNTLIDSLLDFARIGRKEIEKSWVDMRALAQQAGNEQLAAARSNTSIQIAALPGVPGDSDLLSEVWTNLISNAIKFSSKVAQPAIKIDAVTMPDQVVYRVQDNGVGFDMHYADRLFKVFQRLHGVEEFPGTGIGLAIVNRIISKHGGKVWAEAEPHKGATFFFSLGTGA